MSAALLVGCGDDDGSRDNAVADAYIVVVEWILSEPEFAPDPTLADVPPVFVESLQPGEIDLPIRKDLDDPPRQMIDYVHGRPSITTWRVLARTERVSNLPMPRNRVNGGSPR